MSSIFRIAMTLKKRQLSRTIIPFSHILFCLQFSVIILYKISTILYLNSQPGDYIDFIRQYYFEDNLYLSLIKLL